MNALLKTALNAMSTVKKFQKTFIALLLSTLNVFQGKATFRNLSRYSDTSEKRFSRWFRRSFDFVLLNRLMLSDSLSSSGNKREGLGVFYNGCAGKAERGLEISLLSLINLTSNTAYALDARQTIDEKSKKSEIPDRGYLVAMELLLRESV